MGFVDMVLKGAPKTQAEARQQIYRSMAGAVMMAVALVAAAVVEILLGWTVTAVAGAVLVAVMFMSMVQANVAREAYYRLGGERPE